MKVSLCFQHLQLGKPCIKVRICFRFRESVNQFKAEPRESSEYQELITIDDDDDVVYLGGTGGTSDGSRHCRSVFRSLVFTQFTGLKQSYEVLRTNENISKNSFMQNTD